MTGYARRLALLMSKLRWMDLQERRIKCTAYLSRFPKSALGLAAAPTIRYPKLVDLLSARLLLGNGAGFKVEIIGVPKVILGGPQFD